MRPVQKPSSAALVVHEEVAEALAAGGAVVALESTIISHGLPRPDNLAIARRIEDAVRAEGAVPATIAVVAGQVRIGLDDEALAGVAGRDDVIKVSVRDVATVAGIGGYGATTVASTSHLAHRVGIRFFATGGLGGVHRHARDSWDESADLTTLSQTGITLVCAGVKSILDVPATLERLETLNIGLVGFGTDAFPGFYLRDSGYPLEWRLDFPDQVAAVVRARAALGTDRSALVVAHPLSESDQLDPALHDRVLTGGLAAAAAARIVGKDVTPFLLAYFHEHTQGASLEANIRLVLANAALAARIAVATGPPAS